MVLLFEVWNLEQQSKEKCGNGGEDAGEDGGGLTRALFFFLRVATRAIQFGVGLGEVPGSASSVVFDGFGIHVHPKCCLSLHDSRPT